MNLGDILKSYSARVLSNAEAEHYVGGRKNLEDLERGFDLKPLRSNNKVTQWDVRALDRALDRASQEGWPA